MYAAHLYDAVILYARALGKMLKEKNLTEPADIIEAAKNGRELFQCIIANRTYESKSNPFFLLSFWSPINLELLATTFPSICPEMISSFFNKKNEWISIWIILKA